MHKHWNHPLSNGLKRPNRGLGFSLIELMIALSVMGVLVGLAYPAFMDAMRKSRRAEALTSLSTLQQAQERWRANHAAYATSTGSSELNLPTSVTSGRYYAVAIDSADGVAYSLTATAQTGTSQANDGNCVRLRVRNSGGVLYYGSAPATGTAWDESSTNRCWSR